MAKSLCDEKLGQIKEEVLFCKKCSLAESRTCPVIGEGNHQADIMFVGEAPGRQEDATGRPFCGAAGKILDEVLVAVGLSRESVYIANILKCRPPKNRNPLAEEIKSCSGYLDRQIEIVDPRVVCSMGNFASQYLIKKYGLEDKVSVNGKIPGITSLKGKVFKVLNSRQQEISLVALYHPAVATYNINKKPILVEDYQIVADLIR
jgi:uracil-DNA glycosylase